MSSSRCLPDVFFDVFLNKLAIRQLEAIEKIGIDTVKKLEEK